MPRILSESALSRTIDVVRRVENTPDSLIPPQSPSSFGLAFYIGKTDGSGLTARSGTTPGTGTVTLYTLSSGALAEFKDKTGTPVANTVTCKNLSDTAVAASSYVMLLQDPVSGAYWCVWEDC